MCFCSDDPEEWGQGAGARHGEEGEEGALGAPALVTPRPMASGFKFVGSIFGSHCKPLWGQE